MIPDITCLQAPPGPQRVWKRGFCHSVAYVLTATAGLTSGYTVSLPEHLGCDDTCWDSSGFPFSLVLLLFTKHLLRTMRKDSIFKTMVWKERKGDVRQLDGWERSWPPGALPFLAQAHSQADLFSHHPQSLWRWAPCCQGLLGGRKAGCRLESVPGVFNLWASTGMRRPALSNSGPDKKGNLDQARIFFDPSSCRSAGRDLENCEGVLSLNRETYFRSYFRHALQLYPATEVACCTFDLLTCLCECVHVCSGRPYMRAL